ncbi:fibronectin type III domain-containing protein, partial [Candidatus Fermentibacteria bacterium]|nr:fibronectin type III domain-containing protein [Candidatus Fermentibacteria bacterium]
MRKKTLLVLLAVLAPPGASLAQAPAPGDVPEAAQDLSILAADSGSACPASGTETALPPDVAPPGVPVVTDLPNDAGDHLIVSFEPSPDEAAGSILAYKVYRRTPGAADGSGEWAVVETVAAGDPTEIVDGYDPDFPVAQGVRYEYRIAAVTSDCREITGEAALAAVVARGEWFHTDKLRVLIACLLFVGLIFLYFSKARGGAALYLRPIAGIEAIDEAIGRATEMGKPILYVPGLSSIEDVATIASLTILGRVAKKVAEYQTPLRVPNRDPIVYT